MELKDNVYIEGFESFSDMIDFKDSIRYVGEPNPIIYMGKTSNVTEELARNVCDLQAVFNHPEYINIDIDGYKNYRIAEYAWYDCTATQSLKSACDKKYCVIYKK